MVCNRENLLATLPLVEGDLVVRALDRADLNVLAGWPSYPWPFEGFNLAFRTMTARQRDELYAARAADGHRLTLVADQAHQACAGYLGLVQIDWSAGCVGNMGFRIHPDWCDRGLGTRFMDAVVRRFLSHGFESLRLDVVATNGRAIRCYEKCGFAITGEFWQDDPALEKVNLAEPRYAFLRPHVRCHGAIPQVRYYWMHRCR